MGGRTALGGDDDDPGPVTRVGERRLAPFARLRADRREDQDLAADPVAGRGAPAMGSQVIDEGLVVVGHVGLLVHADGITRNVAEATTPRRGSCHGALAPVAPSFRGAPSCNRSSLAG